MPIYDVEMCRIGYGFRTIRVEADNEDEANDRAMDVAGNYCYDEKSAEYEIEDIQEVTGVF